MSRSKARVSAAALEETKARYMVDTNLPSDRRAMVVGADAGNIGQAISDRLRSGNFYVNETGCLAQELEGYADLSIYDTIVFNNGETWLDWIEDQPEDKIHSVVFNSLTATMLGVGAYVRATLDKPGRKHIVMVGSMAYKAVLNGSAPYCAAKAGLAHFAECIAWELAPKNYDVFCVHPSNVENSPMTEETIRGLMRYRNLDRDEAEAYWGASLPKERWLQKYDIANLVNDLVSGRHPYLSGANIHMAGGQR